MTTIPALLVALSALVLAGCSPPPPAAGPAASPNPPAAPVRLGASIDRSIDAVVSRMPDATLAGQLIVVGVEDRVTGRALTELDDHARLVLRVVQPGGVVLFGRSFESIAQVTRLVEEIERGTSLRPFVATDYEGGLVSRLTDTGGIPATPIPPARLIGASFSSGRVDEAVIYDLGRVMGRELRSVGVTMNFAPVVDVDPAEGAGALGLQGRTFSDDPQTVGIIAAQLVRGMQAEGVAAVVKHFPGHGAVDVDSHFGLPTLDADRERLSVRELAAFEIAVAARPVGMMTAHMRVPALDADGLPATLSPAMLGDVARRLLGYDGLIITDALNMRALTGLASGDELVVAALSAGADMLLKPSDPLHAHQTIMSALADGRLDRQRVEESVSRVVRAKMGLGLLEPLRFPGAPAVSVPSGRAEGAVSVLGAADHRALVDRLSLEEPR